MQKLTQGQVDSAMKKLKEWSQVGEAIQRTYQFSDFVTSMKFVDAVAALAEADQHHPDILIRYNRVTTTLSTHDANGITEKDTAAAIKYDDIAKKLQPAPAKRPKDKAAG
jgi:4a-hydroxytetrahydrobiopterin dehydratase